MAREKSKVEEAFTKKQDFESKERFELPKVSETKIKFLVWFTDALTRFSEMKPHHMHTVQAYFRSLGLGEPETKEAYDEALIKFGFRRG